MLSTIAQISGAVTNIVLDYIFIYPLKMGVAGAAWATIIGQIVSLLVAMIFHYKLNKEINGNLKYIKPELGLIKAIYNIGISAAIMQALLSVMMAGMNAILGQSKADPTILVGSFGIYYKIQQIALFSAFVKPIITCNLSITFVHLNQ
jgi:Na+-driven multidrug efflux pump